MRGVMKRKRSVFPLVLRLLNTNTCLNGLMWRYFRLTLHCMLIRVTGSWRFFRIIHTNRRYTVLLNISLTCRAAVICSEGFTWSEALTHKNMMIWTEYLPWIWICRTETIHYLPVFRKWLQDLRRSSKEQDQNEKASILIIGIQMDIISPLMKHYRYIKSNTLNNKLLKSADFHIRFFILIFVSLKNILLLQSIYEQSSK